jgi:hypothetical protein
MPSVRPPWKSNLQIIPLPCGSVVMFRALVRLKSGDPAWRFGSMQIGICIQQGCKIIPNAANQLPEGWDQYIEGEEAEEQPAKRKPGRPPKRALP